MSSTFFTVCFIVLTCYAADFNAKDIGKHIGTQDSVLVADPNGNILFSKNADKRLVPASILKIFTSAMALHYLKPGFKFSTEFYMDKNANLKIKGLGDPLLISEVVADIAKTLSGKIQRYNHLIVDQSYFDLVEIPGVTTSLEPYDAPNGALCVNFNTVYFQREKDGYISAEPQTPLLPIVIDKIRKAGIKKERIILSQQNDECAIYAGQLFKYFLEKQGVKSQGGVMTGHVDKEDSMIFRHSSPFSLEEVISRLMEHSNNFIANQLFITSGIRGDGPPGNLDKGIRAASYFANNILKINIQIAEGSGISRENRISATDLYTVLKHFEPYHYLMSHEENTFFKTGTLKNVRTKAGYIKGANGLYPFVVMINSPGKSTDLVMEAIKKWSVVSGQKKKWSVVSGQ